MHGEPAIMAANAAECAADQNAFWPYQAQLFAQIASQGASVVNVENMQRIGTELGLDEATLSTCLAEEPHRQALQASVAQAISLGLPGTPSILVNGQRLDSLEYTALADAVTAALGQ